MSEETAEEYDPESPTPPERAPPHRSTAPQGEYTSQQVGIGLLVLALGLAVAVTVPLLFA
jgi:uncharacterized protein HemX